MLKNYLVTAFRNLLKTRTPSFVNILGLAIGMTACLLILHYVMFEKSYDTFHDNYERIYRLRYERTDKDGNAVRFASCCPPAAARIRGNYPDVENIARLLKFQAAVSYEDMTFREERIFYAEPELLDIMSVSFVAGGPGESIREPNTAVISQATARRYFGDEAALGKTISVDGRVDYQVVGIFADAPPNSHLKYDFLLSWKNLEALYGPEYYDAWGHTGAYTYLLAAPGTDPSAFEQKLRPLIDTECPWQKEYNLTVDLKMQPLADIHLTSHYMQEYEVNGDRESINILAVIALFIIVMAWVNYVNLSTAGSLRRAREVGLRKVVGASRRQLIIQFFFEIVVLNALAIAATFVIIALVLPAFNRFTGMPSDHGIWMQHWFWLAAGAMFVAGIVLSGVYPVLALSSFEPVKVLKGRLDGAVRGINLRKVLVVFQFAVGVVLIVATLTVVDQISFMRNQDLGFSMDQTLVVRAPRIRDKTYGSKFDAFKTTLLQQSAIDEMCHVTEVPGRQIYWDAGGIFAAGGDVNESKNYQIVGVDYDFADVFDLQFAAGRNFSREFPADEKALILNETAVRYLGFESAESAVGREVNYWGEIYPVIGVVRDFHQQSLKVDFEPHIFRFAPYGRGSMGMIAVKISSDDMTETVALVKEQYDGFFPGNSFDYFFLDEYFNQQYSSDELFGKVYTFFAALAIIITVLGIYGLSSYSIARMTKEIGIRKVLGASVSGIVGLLTREFLILLTVANALAWPVAYVAMHRWLEGFAFRTEMNVGIFLLAGLITAGVAMATISYQVIKAATANPVDAIQYE